MSVKDCIQGYDTSLRSFETALNQGRSPAPEYLEQFQKSQFDFYDKISRLDNGDVQDLENISASLSEVIEKTKQIELRFTLEKQNGVLEHKSMVKVLRTIADSLRGGEESEALDEFKRSVPDGEGSVAGDVFYCLWKVRNQPNYTDFGRASFNNANSSCHSTPLQKALAVELTMVSVICKAFENGQPERAYAEFHELPYRMKEQLFRLLARKEPLFSDLERARKWFFGTTVEPKAKIEHLQAYQNELEQIYSQASESDHVRMLQQDVQSKENLFHSALNQSVDAKWKLFQLSQQIQGKQNTKLLNEVAALQNQIWSQYTESLVYKSEAHHLGIENQQLKAQSSLESKKVELIKEEDYLNSDETIRIEKFAQYVKKNCPNIQIEDVRKLIVEGKRLIEKIQNGKAASISPEERKKKIVPLMWYMMYFAECKNQGFSQGTIIFRDPGHAIVKFFLESGRPSVYLRSSTHFKGRVLPTFFEGTKQTTTYGIDHDGLPGGKKTVNFSPIGTKDGLDWSFFKPEDWGLGDPYQFTWHTVDFFKSRWAHLTGTANGPDDRKEHVHPEVRTAFAKIYAEAAPGQATPEDVKKFGVAGMKSALEEILNVYEISNETRHTISLFLGELGRNYDHLNARSGHEAALGNSLLLGDIPQQHMHQSVRGDSLEQWQLRDAQMLVKNAMHKDELVEGLARLKQKPPLNHSKDGIVNEIAEGFLLHNGSSGLDKQAIFTQINSSLQQNSVQLTVDGQPVKNAQSILDYLLKLEKEETALRWMALMQEQISRPIASQIQQWFGQPATRGVYIKQMVPIKIDVRTGKNPNAEIAMQFQFVTIEDIQKPIATIEGKMKVDYHYQASEITARVV